MNNSEIINTKQEESARATLAENRIMVGPEEDRSYSQIASDLGLYATVATEPIDTSSSKL